MLDQSGTKIHKSACRMCHGGCGVLVTVTDGKVEKIVGDPDSPLNRGKICIKAPASIELVNHPDRLTHPLKRVGPRGGGEWARISWDEAYDILAERLGTITRESGAFDRDRHRNGTAPLRFRPPVRQRTGNPELV